VAKRIDQIPNRETSPMSDQPQLSRPIVLSSQLESMLDDNPTYTQSPFFHGWNKAVHNLRDWMIHKSNNPQFHWNATVRRHIDNDPCTQRLAVIHAPSSCSVFAPTLGLVVPAYALQDRENPNHLMVIPQFLAEDGSYQLEG